MSPINKNASCRDFQPVLDAAVYSVTTAEPLEKITKIVFRTIDLFVELTGRVYKPIHIFSMHLKNTVVVFEGINFVNRVKELACPDEQGQYFFKKNTWQKCADRVFLTASSIFKMMNAAIRFGFIHLAHLAKMTFGRIPLLRLIPDTLVAISSFFSLWDNANLVEKTSKNLLVANDKADKWTQRAELIDQIRKGNVDEISRLKSYYQGRVVVLEKVIDSLDPELQKTGLFKANAAYKKYQARLDMIGDLDHVKLADELAMQDIKYKQVKWIVVQNNETINLNKAWLSIASAASKIFVITLASAMTALQMVTLPYVVSLLTVGIAVDSIGLTKTFYDYSVKPKLLPIKVA